MSQNLRVVIVGGGLAGMAAASALESAGSRVTLIESRRLLGGRAGSFEDPATGALLDNCQHVLLGCCTNLIDFYRRIGVLDRIRFHRAIHFRDERGRRFDLEGAGNIPAPLHLAGSLAQFDALSLAERVALSRAMLAMLRLGRNGRGALANKAFGEWLDEQRQPESLVRRLYDPILISALNEETRRASAESAISVFQDSLLSNSAGYPIGIPTCPLSELYATPPCADVRLGTRVASICFEGVAASIQLQSGERIQDFDALVLATNHYAAQKMIPEELRRRDRRFHGLRQLQSVPILGVHLWFDRPVMAESHNALLEGPLQWIFRKDATGSSLHGVISAARQWVDRDSDEMLRLFEAQVRRTLPMASGARLLRGLVVIEKRATFSPLPGVNEFRPAQAPDASGIENLFLAGDYTRTGWPATMEGAVRSGYLAAEAILRSPRRFIVPDLPTEWPARLLARPEPEN